MSQVDLPQKPRIATLASILAALVLAGCAASPSVPSAAVEKPATEADALSQQDRLAFFINDVRRGECDKIEPALKSGLPINGFDNLDQTPLIAAVSQNQVACVKQLIARGADVNLADHAGWSPLIHAAYFGSGEELLSLLVDHGANVNAQNNRGLTALYLASAAGHEPQVQLLLAHGANPAIASASGYTPVRVAQLRGLSKIVELLEAKPATATP
ncbi:MAG: ankyrin repeat protein [Hydrocarboniphaga sp.]|uniref:ankyrin repeat domain-containing protein n=1 Tax=Hydrocarboniphaga sp. TaxID=2033016 RepID=UPI002605A839|nr:ankyrin repeat domain-containing protein [Hydrocarboniphaga sp.]MDB5969729.1 ankyrin repeat protein [Hydrocarboniphaga sp.]